MKNVKINNEIDLTYPDNFNEMSEEELTRYFSSPADRWGAFNAEDHIILSVGWTKIGLLHKLSDAELYLTGVEGRMRRNLINYQRLLSYKAKVGTKKARARAIRFEYRVNDSVMIHVADLVVFKYKGKFYTIHFITRKINAAETRPAFEEVLKSVKLS